MTEASLKNLTRKQLLELLLKQTERADALQAELDEVKRQLQDRTLMEAESGSLAEAALRLNGVFEAADAAAAQYLENLREQSEQAEAIAAEKAETMLREAEQRCHEMEQACRQKLDAERECLEQQYRQKRMLDELLQENG